MGNGSEETGRSVWVRHQARSEGGSAFPQQTGQSKSEQNSENCGRVVNVGQHSAKLLGKRNGLLRRDSRKGASNHKGEYSSHIALPWPGTKAQSAFRGGAGSGSMLTVIS